MSAVLAEPIVRLVYQHGSFDADQTVVVAQCLAAFSLGLAFNGAMLMLNRSFFSLQSPWVPTAVALGDRGSFPGCLEHFVGVERTAQAE